MEINIKEIFKMIFFLEKEFTLIVMEPVMKDSLDKDYLKGKEFKFKLMEINIKDNSKKGKNMDKVCTLGQTVIIMMEDGKMDWDKEQEHKQTGQYFLMESFIMDIVMVLAKKQMLMVTLQKLYGKTIL